MQIGRLFCFSLWLLFLLLLSPVLFNLFCFGVIAWFRSRPFHKNRPNKCHRKVPQLWRRVSLDYFMYDTISPPVIKYALQMQRKRTCVNYLRCITGPSAGARSATSARWVPRYNACTPFVWPKRNSPEWQTYAPPIFPPARTAQYLRCAAIVKLRARATTMALCGGSFAIGNWMLGSTVSDLWMPYKHFCFGCTRRNASNNNNEHKKIAVMAHIPNGAPALILYSPMQNDAQRLGKREDQKVNLTTTDRSGKSLKFACKQ